MRPGRGEYRARKALSGSPDAALADGAVLAAEQHYAQAAKYFSAAIKQLGISPDASVVYQLHGRILEQQRKYKDAIALYQQFLKKRFPDSIDATAVQSFITQLQKQLEEQ